jgi:hypothetical protein
VRHLLESRCSAVVAPSVSGCRHEDLLASRHGDSMFALKSTALHQLGKSHVNTWRTEITRALASHVGEMNRAS